MWKTFIDNVQVDYSDIPQPGYRKENFHCSFFLPKNRDVTPEDFVFYGFVAGKAKSTLSPYIRTNGDAVSPINFKKDWVIENQDEADPEKSKRQANQRVNYLNHLDWAISIGVKDAERLKQVIESDAFKESLETFEKSNGITNKGAKYLVFDGNNPKPVSNHPKIQKEWVNRLSEIEGAKKQNTAEEIECSLTGKKTSDIVYIFPCGLDSPTNHRGCAIVSRDKEYTHEQGSKKDAKPMDRLEADNFIKQLQWYLVKSDPPRYIRISQDTFTILATSTGDVFTGDIEDVDYYLEHGRNTAVSYWRSPLDGKEIRPDPNTIVHGLTCRFKSRGRVYPINSWQGVSSTIESNYSLFLNAQKETGEIFWRSDKTSKSIIKTDVLPIWIIAKTMEPFADKLSGKIAEQLYRCALYGEKPPLHWLTILNRMMALHQCVSMDSLQKEKQQASPERLTKIINLLRSLYDR
jgi:hypothetical protein